MSFMNSIVILLFCCDQKRIFLFSCDKFRLPTLCNHRKLKYLCSLWLWAGDFPNPGSARIIVPILIGTSQLSSIVNLVVGPTRELIAGRTLNKTISSVVPPQCANIFSHLPTFGSNPLFQLNEDSHVWRMVFNSSLSVILDIL